MSSTIKVDNIQNQCGANIINESSNTITIGASGDTVSLASGASQTGFGRTGTVDWETTPKTSSFTAANGEGYFVNTTSSAITVTLPAGSAGDIVALKDYTNTWNTNNVTLTPNGTDKIAGVNANGLLNTNAQSVTLIFTDSTRGWIDIHDSTSNVEGASFISATGGTVVTSGDFKTHIFTGPGTFCVSCAGNAAGSNGVEYMVVAGGGGGGQGCAGGSGGAGGMRFRTVCCSASPFNAPAPLQITATAYPITVGGGGPGGGPSTPGGGSQRGTSGSNSIFSTITSAGGGGGGGGNPGGPNGNAALPGGSGGGGGHNGGTLGCGNQPPVSPPQGHPGKTSAPVNDDLGGGGGGAGEAATESNPTTRADGGDGTYIPTTFIGPTAPSYGETGPQGRFFAGGGGGSSRSTPANPGKGNGGLGGGADGTTNTNGSNGSTNMGGGASGGARPGPDSNTSSGGTGGSGIVMIRYKFQ